MTMRSLAFTLSLLVVGCYQLTGCVEEDIGTDQAPKTGAYAPAPPTSPPSVNPDTIPGQIGDYCLLTPCATDDDCYPIADVPVGCCIQNVCWRGWRFDGVCVNVGPAPASETCPNDGDGDGVCSYRDRWYVGC